MDFTSKSNTLLEGRIRHSALIGPVGNFELFYVESDVHSSNATVRHSEKMQEYIFLCYGGPSVIQGRPCPLVISPGMIFLMSKYPILS